MSVVRKSSAIGSSPHLPPLCDRGHTLVFTRSYLRTTGAAVVMRNLLARFDPASYTLIVSDLRGTAVAPPPEGVNVYAVDSATPKFVPGRWDHLWRQYGPFTRSRVIKLAASLSPAAIVGVFPDLEFLQLARETARALRVPWVAYLHDAVIELMAHSRYAPWAIGLQPKVFREASSVFVTGNLGQLYSEKYGQVTKPLPIGYPDPIPADLPDVPDVAREAYMGGSVYAVNARTTKRVLAALEELKCPFVLATTSTDETLKGYGITGEWVKKEFINDRTVYLESLKRRGVLVVLMDWPDESEVNEGELANAFPTKATEYGASGRPVLVHCPEHYALARFFREHECGLVVSERDHKALVDAISKLLEGGDDVVRMRRAGLQAARTLSLDNLAPRFQSEISAVSRLRWGEKVSS